MPPQPLILTWHGPFTFRAGAANSLWVAESSAEAGIYVWAVPTPDGLLVYHVGGSGKPFWLRHIEHLEAFALGGASVHRAASLAAGRRDPVHRGVPPQQARSERSRDWFHNKHKKLQPELQAMLSLIAIFLAPLSVSLHIRRRVECAIIQRLRLAGREESKLLDAGLKTSGRLPAEVPLRVASVSQVAVRGLTGEFDA